MAANGVVNFNENELLQYSSGNQKLLGSGLTGNVYEGFIPSENPHNLEAQGIAIKKTKNISKSNTEQFENEITWMSNFNHPNIIKLIGYCKTPNAIYIVYELAKGGDLLTKFTGFDWEQTLGTLHGIAAAIDYLHSEQRRLRIGDLKLSNILLDEKLQPKLGDFGTIGPEKPHQPDQIVLGTPEYMDPLTGARGGLLLDDDIYAFGVIILKLISKKAEVRSQRDHISVRTEARYAEGSHAVHRKLIRSGCREKDAKKITELGLSLTRFSPTEQRSQAYEDRRPPIREVIEELRTLKVVVWKKQIHTTFQKMKKLFRK